MPRFKRVTKMARASSSRWSREIDERPVEHVDRPGFGDERVQDPHIAELRVRDPGEGRDAAPEIEQGVHLDARLGRPEPGPGKHREAQVDRRCIQGVHRPIPLIELLEAQRFVEVEAPSLHHEALGEVGDDAPIPLLVRIGERAPGDRRAEAEVVELVRNRAEAGFDVAEVLPIRELSERHGQVLVAAGEPAHAPVAAVASGAPIQGEALAVVRHDL
jgi:hypothetical protein